MRNRGLVYGSWGPRSDGGWRTARVSSRAPERPLASARNVVTLEPVETFRVPVVLEHDLPAYSGITELVIR